MGKLVRDLIPQIIRAQGRTAQTSVLDDDAYRVALRDKLVEEAQELCHAAPESALEEAADVYEVLLAIAAHEGWTVQQIAERAGDKRHVRGGFDERLFLESYSPAAGVSESSR